MEEKREEVKANDKEMKQFSGGRKGCCGCKKKSTKKS